MADVVPNEGEEQALRAILNQTLYMGLMSNTPASVLALGDAIAWADILPVGNLVGADEKTLVFGDWTIPSGAGAGNPATAPPQEFVADTGGTDAVSGYYLRTAGNKLLVVGLHPTVELTGVLKPMPEGAVYRVNPQYGAF